MQQLKDITGDPTPFLDTIFQRLAAKGVSVSGYELDHICYRTASYSGYELLKSRLAGIGALLKESMINGRPIATFRLFEPIVYGEREIYCIEIPAPKEGSAYVEGYEHVEFVIAEGFDVFMAGYPGLVFDEKGRGKAFNRDVRLGLGELSVKFHHVRLEDIV